MKWFRHYHQRVRRGPQNHSPDPALNCTLSGIQESLALYSPVPALDKACSALETLLDKVTHLSEGEEGRKDLADSVMQLARVLNALSKRAIDYLNNLTPNLQQDARNSIFMDAPLKKQVNELIEELQAAQKVFENMLNAPLPKFSPLVRLLNRHGRFGDTLEAVRTGVDAARIKFETQTTAYVEHLLSSQATILNRTYDEEYVPWEGDIRTKESSWILSTGWLSQYEAALFAQNHMASGGRVSQDPTYIRWKQSKSSVLWIYGQPGCGKTYTTTSVIKSLERAGALYTYHFCDALTPKTTEPSVMLRNLLNRARNILSRQCVLSTELLEISRKTGTPTDIRVLWNLLMTLIDQHDFVIVIDALDDCMDRSQLLQILSDLASQGEGDQNIHLLVTSRRVKDIADAFYSSLSICLDGDNNYQTTSLTKDISNAFQNWPQFSSLPDNLREELIRMLSTGNHGSFSWIRHQSPVSDAKGDRLEDVLSSSYTQRWMLRLPRRDAETCVEALDHIVGLDSVSKRFRTPTFRVLRLMCMSYGLLPRSFVFPYSIVGAEKSRTGEGESEQASRRRNVYGKNVALKCIVNSESYTRDIKHFFREVVKWKHISHPNIVPYVAVALGEHQVYITNEWMNRGNVKQYLTQNPDANRRNLIYDAGLGLSYLHTNDIIHGNLRATNVLINDAGRACIADFGIATALYKDSVAPAFTSTFISFENVRWMAPEVLFPDSVETSSPLAEGDVYSFAMVMWEIFTGQVPFNRVHPTAVICKVVQGARPSRPANVASLGLSDAVWDLMCLCWQEDRFRRPKMPGLLVYLRETLQLSHEDAQGL